MTKWLADQIRHALKVGESPKLEEPQHNNIEIEKSLLEELKSDTFTSSKLIIHINIYRVKGKRPILAGEEREIERPLK